MKHKLYMIDQTGRFACSRCGATEIDELNKACGEQGSAAPRRTGLRIYVSGPIKGKAQGNRPAFAAAKQHLQALGHDAVTPFDCEGGEYPDNDAGYAQYMRDDLLGELRCEAIYLLEGWEQSAGARVEFLVATACGLRVFYQMREGMVL